MVMLIAWQGTGDSRYQAPLQKSLEAMYAKSELQGNVDNLTKMASQKAPVPAAIAPVGYSLLIKKQIGFTSAKFTPMNDTVTTYNYDQRSRSGSVAVTWHY